MGKIITPKHYIRYRDNTAPQSWQTLNWPKGKRVSDANAEEWRREMNKSFLKGGTNYHVTLAENSVIHIIDVHVINQRLGQVAAKAKAPMFEVVE